MSPAPVGAVAGGRESLKRVLVTGTSGFIGQAVAQRLRNAGVSVVGTVRPHQPPGQVPYPTLPFDVRLPRTWDLAVEGYAAIVHCAAAAANSQREARDVQEQNARASLALAQLAAARDIPRFVFISSLSAHAGNPSSYAAAKLQVEQRLPLVADGRYIVLRPGLVMGDAGRGLFAKLCRLVRACRIIPIPRRTGRFSTVHVDDLTAVVLRCLSGPVAVTVDVSADERLSLQQMITLIAERLFAIHPRFVAVNNALFELATRSVAVLGSKAPITLDNFHGLVHPGIADASAAPRLYDITPRPVAESLRAVAEAARLRCG